MIFLILLLTFTTSIHIIQGDSYCIGPCSNPRIEKYETICCNPHNLGDIVKIESDNNRQKYLLCPTTIPSGCQQPMYHSCNDIQQYNPSLQSGYYNIILTNGSIDTIYCDMDGSYCDGKGGWTRVAYLNMTEPGSTCPPGLSLQLHSNINHGVCGRPNPSNAGCDSTFFSSKGFNYSNVCGHLRGYQFGSVDAFHLVSVDSFYVEGVSLTYGNSPRKHIWTFASGEDDFEAGDDDCPCNNGSNQPIPLFVGNDYYCESGNSVHDYETKLYSMDALWDGEQCNGIEYPCCSASNMPWFLKSLSETVTDDIELRVCSDQGLNNEGNPLDIIELFIK